MSILRLALPLAVASTLAAQTFVLPTALTATSGNAMLENGFWENGLPATTNRIQILHETAAFPIASGSLKAVAFRREAQTGLDHSAGTATLTAKLSLGAKTGASASTLFANNLGAVVTTVFTGSVNLPASVHKVPTPASYPFEVSIPFSSFFAFAKAGGQSLVLDLTFSDTAIANGQTWLLDAEARATGSWTFNSTNPLCKFSNGQNSNAVQGNESCYLGGPWTSSFPNLKPPTPGVAVLGGTGKGGKWNGFTLPLDLAPLGAPSCLWAVSWDVSVPVGSNANGVASWPTLTVPNQPGLAGKLLYDQMLFVDPAANALGVVSTLSRAWTIGSGAYPAGATIGKLAYKPTDTAGSVARTVPVTRFSY